MIILQCDGPDCGRQSPDEGKDVARIENWVTCTFQREDQRERDMRGFRVKLLLCTECFEMLLDGKIEVKP